MKEQATKQAVRAKRVISNGEQFIQASALAVVTGYTLYAERQLHLKGFYSWVVTGACAIVAIRAFVEYVKFLDKD